MVERVILADTHGSDRFPPRVCDMLIAHTRVGGFDGARFADVPRGDLIVAGDDAGTTYQAPPLPRP